VYLGEGGRRDVLFLVGHVVVFVHFVVALCEQQPRQAAREDGVRDGPKLMVRHHALAESHATLAFGEPHCNAKLGVERGVSGRRRSALAAVVEAPNRHGNMI
jgi:hypothetical protein